MVKSASSSRDDSQERKSFLDKPNSSKTAKSAVSGASEKSSKTEKSKRSEQSNDRSVKSTVKNDQSQKTTKSMKNQKSTTSIQSIGRRGPKMSDGTEFDTGPYGYVFSFIYLAVLWGLAIILAIALVAFNYSRLDPQYPTYFGEGSFLGDVPKVTFDPNPRRFMEEGVKNVMEWNIYDFRSYLNYLIRYKQLLKQYSNGVGGYGYGDGESSCTNKTIGRNESCTFDRFTGFDECRFGKDQLESGFGFSKGQPCIMLKLNKIVGWAPNFPEHQNETGIKFKCSSNDDVQFEFYPATGIPVNYFPYSNQKGYEQPFQMVKLTNITVDKETTIECWPTTESIYELPSGKKNELRFHILMRRESVDDEEEL
uniref:Sodium/potassium-transporting ATPase subunit beta n=1 Tax=Caenorhabditis tropicalis TaxID=1561998 RepID=A0A1I7UNF4_9PELO